jgi:hypothetical protein
MRALLKTLHAVGMVAAVTAAASAQEVRSNRPTGSVNPSGGTTYDAGGAPYSPHQYNYDSSNDFQLQGKGLNDPDNARNPNPANARNPNDEKNKDDVK